MPPGSAPRAWPERASANPAFRALARHQFWRKVLGRIGPRYALAKVGAVRMYLDLRENLGVSRHIFKHGSYDPFLSERMPEWIGPDGNVIDIGANIGYHAVLAGSITRGTVWAFEPESANHALLLANIELNGLRNVRAVRKAAGERRDVLRLYLSESNAGDHRLFSGGEARASIEVPVVSLDEELAGAGPIAFVKIDVQGYEERALRGMRRILTGNAAIRVASEFEPHSIAASGADPAGLLDFMESLGFRWRLLGEDGAGAAIDRPTLIARCGTRGHVDLLFSRE